MTDQPIDTPDEYEDQPSEAPGEDEDLPVGDQPGDDGAAQIAADDAGASAMTEDPQADLDGGGYGDGDGEEAD